jgi:predicted amidophosphoribosyltransferase
MDKDDKRRVLGDAIILFGTCGFAKRYMELEGPPDLDACPDCGNAMIKDCPACHAPMRSIMQVDCRVCGEPIRDGELFGVPIRRKAEPRDKGPVQLPGDDD